MSIFNLLKTSQQKPVEISVGYNIINFIKLLFQNTDKDLLQSNFTPENIKVLKRISNKIFSGLNSMDIISIRRNIPAYLKTAEVLGLIDHALNFLSKKDTNTDARKGNANLPNVISAPILKRSEQEQAPSQREELNTPYVKKKLKSFTFKDKISPYWKNLNIVFYAKAEYISIQRELSQIEGLEIKANATLLSIEIEHIDTNQFAMIVDILTSKYESLPTDELTPVLANKEYIAEFARTVDLAIEDARDLTRENWMYIMIIKNFPALSNECQVDIIDCIDTSFIGVTNDIEYNKRSIGDDGLAIPRKRLCQTSNGTRESITLKGLYVRGDIADFQSFFNMCKVRKITFNRDVSNIVFSDFTSGRFYNPRTGEFLPKQSARLEGVLDAKSDGYKNDEDFRSVAREKATKGLKIGVHSSEQGEIRVYDRQLEGIEFLYSRTKAILGDDTGGGKTFQSIVAADMRLASDSRKTKKDMKAIVITKSAVVEQYKEEIVRFTGIDKKLIWTGDQILEELLRTGQTDLGALSKNTTPPVWKWCVMNYNKFSIPPRPDIMKSSANSRELALTRYKSMMTNSLNLAKSIVAKLITYTQEPPLKGDNEIKNFIKEQTIDPSSPNFKAVLYSSVNQKWDKEYPQEQNENIVKSTAYLLLIGNYSTIQNAIPNMSNVINKEVEKQRNLVAKYVTEINDRLGETDKLTKLKKDLELTSDQDEKAEIEKDIKIIEKSGKAIDWGYDGKRKILTSYFNSLSRMGILDIVILDEIHTVKNGNPENRNETAEGQHEGNHTTFNTQIVTSGANNVWGFSATIVANTPIDLYNQLVAINSPLGDIPYDNFITDIVRTPYNRFNNISDASAIKTIMLQHGLYMQRSKEEMYQAIEGSELPKQFVEDVELNNDNGEYDRIFNEGMSVLMGRGTDNNQLAVYGVIRSSLALSKCDQTIDFCFKKIAEGKRVAVFTDIKPAGEKIRMGIANRVKELPKNHKFYNKEVYLLNGDSPDANKERFTNINEFKKLCNDDICESKYVAMVISYDVGGTGISMENASDTIVFNDLPDTPLNDTQARGRFFRLNTNKDNTVFYMLLNIEAEHKMHDTLMRKIQIANAIQKLTIEENKLIMEGRQHSEPIKAIRKKREKYESDLLGLSMINAVLPKGGLSSRTKKDTIRKKSFFETWYKQASFSQTNTKEIL